MTMTPNAPPPTPENRALAPSPGSNKRMTLRSLFDQQKPELTKLLPRGMDAERLYRMALTECVKNPKLLECTAESWALAMQTCGAQGLYPDSGLGYMYLIPRNRKVKRPDGPPVTLLEVQAQRGYQGDMALARKSGEIASFPAPEVVYERDHYKVTRGLDPSIEHVPYDGDEDPGKLRAVYAVAKLKSGETVFVALSRRDVMRHKASAQGTDRDDSPWKTHEAAMWKKTAIHELFKWLPKSTEQAEEIARTVLAEGTDPRVLEAHATALGTVALPGQPTEAPASLDAVAAGLEQQPGAACAHGPIVTALPFLPPSQRIPCTACGEEVMGTGEPEAREPGSDDGDDEPSYTPPPSAPPAPGVEESRKAVEQLAQAAKAQGTGRQTRLKE